MEILASKLDKNIQNHWIVIFSKSSHDYCCLTSSIQIGQMTRSRWLHLHHSHGSARAGLIMIAKKLNKKLDEITMKLLTFCLDKKAVFLKVIVDYSHSKILFWLFSDRFSRSVDILSLSPIRQDAREIQNV